MTILSSVNPNSEIPLITGLDASAEQGASGRKDPATEDRFRRVRDWFQQARDALAEARAEAVRDHDFYDGDQWDEADKLALAERGQQPLVFNQIKPPIDWIIGTQKTSRMEWRVLPREAADTAGAEIKTKLMKYVSDINKGEYQKSYAFADAVKSGLGWLEIGARSDPEDDPIFFRFQDWRYLWFDPLATERDMSDARFLFRAKWIDLDSAIAMFPGREAELRASAFSMDQAASEDLEIVDEQMRGPGVIRSGTGEVFSESMISPNRRRRVLLVECWYREPVRMQVLRAGWLGPFNGLPFNPENGNHTAIVDEGLASVHDAVRMQVRCMFFSGNFVLEDKPSPYIHNRFPFVPVWGFRRRKDGTPYGVIRNLRDPQQDLNKRRSKALWMMSADKVIFERGAVEDPDEFSIEYSRPDARIEVLNIDKIRELPQSRDIQMHVDFARENVEFIQMSSGVTDELLGRSTNAVSGKAIQARQSQGQAAASELFDNLKYGMQLAGEITLSLIEQYYSYEKVVRIVGEQGQLEFVEINKPQPDGSLLNDITASKADFVMSEQPWSASDRQRLFESMMQMMNSLDPGFTIHILDLVMDMSDLPGKDALVKRIREVNGMEDPNAGETDPQAQQRRMIRAQKEEMQAQMEQAAARLELQKLQMEVEKLRAETRLKNEQAQSERVDQEVAVAGAEFDEQKLSIERAEALHAMERTEKSLEIQEKQISVVSSNRGQEPKSGGRKGAGRDERGIKSNNRKD